MTEVGANALLDFRLLFEASPDVLLVLLPDAPHFTMVAATDERLRVTHTTREATLGKGLFSVFPDNPDDVGATGTSNLRASLLRVIDTRAADTMAVQKYDIRGPDGTFQSKYWSPKNIPLLSATGEVLYILHRVEDVTELVQASELGQVLRDRTQQMERDVVVRSRELATANQSLREANAKLGELDRAKTAFFSNVSHEFRTPLTLILGLVERGRTQAAQLSPPDLEALQRNALRLLNLVNSLLDFSRIESGRLELAIARTDLGLVTRGLVGSFQSLFDDAGLKLVLEFEPLPEPVYVDVAQWEKVVMNLMSNAFKFTFDGEVKVSLRAVDGQVLFSVSDTGVGIPEAELGRVFERFHRVEGTRGRSFEGSGIGLALVYEIVKRHGGTVQVSSSVGKGTSFVVALQLGTQHLPSDKLVSEPTQAIRASDGRSATMAEARRWLAGANTQPPTEGPAKGHGLADAADSSLGISVRAGKVSGRVLIADDNADMREYLTQLVSEHWQTTLAVNGKQALELALKDPPDLVLSDVMMPEMDGVALLNALRTDPRTATVPVILISARAGEEERLAGLETGADDYVLKPFSAREVLTRIRTHLEMAKVRRGAAEAAQVLADTRAGLLERLEQEHATLQRTLAELQHTQAQLVQSAKMASLGELVAGIAHEINNPLAFGSSHLNTIQRSLTTIAPHIEQRLPEEAMPAWERARARLTETQVALNRIRELVLQLRTFSRLDEGERKQIDLAEAVESVLTILAHRFGDRITIKKRLSEPREIDCFAGLFNQAVMNLVANAIEAIEGPGEIEIESRMRDNWFELTVSDTGTGVPEPLRDRIFEPFFTTKPVGQGTGLGLAITYSIAQKHGGSVRLVPREVRGTVAELRFPVQAGASSRD